VSRYVEDVSLITQDKDEKECSEAVTEEGGESVLTGLKAAGHLLLECSSISELGLNILTWSTLVGIG